MKTTKYSFLVLLSISLFFCQKKEHSSEQDMVNLVLAAGYITTQTNCDNNSSTTPSFAKMVSDGKLSSCYKCHDGTRGPLCPDSDLNVHNYDSIITKVTRGQPLKSFLYLTVSQGAMSQYSNSDLNQLLYDWIKNCAPR